MPFHSHLIQFIERASDLFFASTCFSDVMTTVYDGLSPAIQSTHFHFHRCHLTDSLSPRVIREDSRALVENMIIVT